MFLFSIKIHQTLVNVRLSKTRDPHVLPVERADGATFWLMAWMWQRSQDLLPLRLKKKIQLCIATTSFLPASDWRAKLSGFSGSKDTYEWSLYALSQRRQCMQGDLECKAASETPRLEDDLPKPAAAKTQILVNKVKQSNLKLVFKFIFFILDIQKSNTNQFQNIM